MAIAVSRFTIATSVPESIGAIGANMPFGFDASWLARFPSKCVSPPNAIVTGWSLPRRGRVVEVVVDDVVDALVTESAPRPTGATVAAAVGHGEGDGDGGRSRSGRTRTTRRTTDQPTERLGPYDARAMRRPTLSPEQYRRITVGAAVLLGLIIVTGAAVRLTGSGLGCPDWPNCTSGNLAPTAEVGAHGWIEFVNRMVTGLVSIAVIVAVLGALVRTPRRRDLTWLSLGLVLGVIAQALLGALVVQKLLDPPFVMGHFLLSAVLLAERARARVARRRPRRHARAGRGPRRGAPHRDRGGGARERGARDRHRRHRRRPALGRRRQLGQGLAAGDPPRPVRSRRWRASHGTTVMIFLGAVAAPARRPRAHPGVPARCTAGSGCCSDCSSPRPRSATSSTSTTCRRCSSASTSPAPPRCSPPRSASCSAVGPRTRGVAGGAGPGPGRPAVPVG